MEKLTNERAITEPLVAEPDDEESVECSCHHTQDELSPRRRPSRLARGSQMTLSRNRD